MMDKQSIERLRDWKSGKSGRTWPEQQELINCSAEEFVDNFQKYAKYNCETFLMSLLLGIDGREDVLRVLKSF
jgi:hypothetical protein